ncbi:olfactory receptor-like protein COR4 isoform X2 [Rhineura floridana]|uniref:olfactory receptor-like protein COR4 isoform X2 n=1 Tax=Rhineura floridana TaxID=261503 RepID=UPI002AC7FFBA|nr:olfactory receptor-like protein COR4 isoform X2 [Rhineura floridana]
MAKDNYTMVTNFILSGLTEHLGMRPPLFVVFLVIYIFTLVGNLGVIVLIWIDPQLHTPMYFFLSSLSLLDACYSTTITPNMLVNILVGHQIISYAACIAQYFYFVIFATTEFFLLAAMAYDRYVAICNPLLYTSVMTKKRCAGMIAASYISGIVNSLVHTCGLFRLSFCGSNVINHIFCDHTALLKLACNDIHINEMLIFIFGSFLEISSLIVIVTSYVFIIIAVLRIRSVEGRHKAFSTCASHLTAVAIYHGTILFMYFRPSSSYSLDTDKMASVFYTVIIPMLNPLIYSLRNKDVK